jgi:hypothetical protein
MLASVQRNARQLDVPDNGYYELLRLIRTAQVVHDMGLREHLIQSAHTLIDDLPDWNRYFAANLVAAVERNAGPLYGVEAPFDATDWEEAHARI